MDYLVSTNLEELRRLYIYEKDAKVKQRLLMCIHRKEGKDYREIAEIVKAAHSTTHEWVNRFNGCGIEGLRRKPGSGGRNRYLTRQQERGLARKLQHTPMSTRDVRSYITEQYGMQYHPNSMPRLLRRIGQSLITARPRHMKADPEEQAAFREHIKKAA